jgi:DNA-binding CsgD family transcriptional regulator/predicted transcriptional regulator
MKCRAERVGRDRQVVASIDWSYALLDEADRVVFRRLAVFADGFSLEAARGVCAADEVDRDVVREAIGRLVDKSLVVADLRQREARYRLLETIRHYTAHRLVQAEDVVATRDRHFDYFLSFVEHEAEYDNLRVALDRGLAATEPEGGQQLAAALAWLWHLESHGRERLDYLQRAIRCVPGQRSRLQAHLLAGLALVADTASPVELKTTRPGKPWRSPPRWVISSFGRSASSWRQSASSTVIFQKAWKLVGEALNAAQAAGDEFVVDRARALQGIILHLRDRHAEAEPLSQRHGLPRDTRRQMAYTVAVDRLRATLGERVVDQAWAEGAELSLEQADAHVRRSRGARERPSTGWNSLTPTELEVVQLMVDGLNKPEVEARLFMSRGTVKTHLSHVYTNSA